MLAKAGRTRNYLNIGVSIYELVPINQRARQELTHSSYSSSTSSLFGVGASSFQSHVLWSCASSISTCFSFMYFLITSLHISFGLPICRYSPFPCYHHYIIFTLSLHMTTSQSCFLNYVCHTCPCSIYCFPVLLNRLYSHHHLDILISLLSNKLCSAFLSAQFLLPYIIIFLMTV